MSTPTYRALLIGNSTYPSDPGNLPDLEGPRNDLSLLRDALSDERYGLFPSDNVRLVAERTMPEVLREIEELLRSTTSRDCVLVYYSGHGRLDQSNDFYLCTRDTHADFLRSTAVNAATVSKMIDESAAGTTIILLDCCHSGAFKAGDDVAQRLAGGGRFVITSCRTGELANDADVQNHASMFTHWLVEGLRGGATDEDGDGLVGLEGLYDFLFSRLRELGRPTPQKRFSGSGDVPIALEKPFGATGDRTRRAHRADLGGADSGRFSCGDRPRRGGSRRAGTGRADRGHQQGWGDPRVDGRLERRVGRSEH